jgi:hypothetical protein
MKIKRLAGIGILIFALVMGCSGYGLIRKQTATDNKMTLAELIENWEDYHVYYGKPWGSIPINIMFDPKNDETRLAGDGGWHKIADQQTLSEIMERIEIAWANHEVMIIEGPDRRFFGYMYTSWGSGGDLSPRTSSVYDVRMVDEHTVHVSQGI